MTQTHLALLLVFLFVVACLLSWRSMGPERDETVFVPVDEKPAPEPAPKKKTAKAKKPRGGRASNKKKKKG